MSLSPLTLCFDGLREFGKQQAVVVNEWAWCVADRSGVVPAGYRSDLESIPGWAQGVIPRAGKMLRASIIHDHLITSEGYAHETDALFVHACRMEGLNDLRIWLVRGALWANTSIRIAQGKGRKV